MFPAVLSITGEDAGTSTLPLCCSVEAKLGDFAASAFIAVSSDSGDVDPTIFVLDCDCGVVASILLDLVCEEIERPWFPASCGCIGCESSGPAGASTSQLMDTWSPIAGTFYDSSTSVSDLIKDETYTHVSDQGPHVMYP